MWPCGFSCGTEEWQDPRPLSLLQLAVSVRKQPPTVPLQNLQTRSRHKILIYFFHIFSYIYMHLFYILYYTILYDTVLYYAVLCQVRAKTCLSIISLKTDPCGPVPQVFLIDMVQPPSESTLEWCRKLLTGVHEVLVFSPKEDSRRLEQVGLLPGRDLCCIGSEHIGTAEAHATQTLF